MSVNTNKPTTSFGVTIAGIGAYAPETIISNDDLTQLVDTSDEWIASRTGIRQRHVVTGNQSIVDLAENAIQDALASAGMDGEEVDLIIAATSTPDTIYPATACQLQHRIGASRAVGFDIAMACSGFVYGIITASQFLRAGTYKTAIVVASDIHSRYTDWSDRNTCVLFGDGAGAIILKADPETDDILACELGVDGSKGAELTLHTSAQNCPLVKPREPGNNYVYMNGREMFKFAVNTVPMTIRSIVDKAGMTLDDLDHVVLHQANIRILQAMNEKMGIPEEKLIVNLQKYGNTSAASVPLALNEAVLDGRVKQGDVLAMCGFGAGAAWGTTVLRWSCVDQRLGKHQETSDTQEIQLV
ncbi:MAG: ketoacyl-ACP synthase III [Vampirovibrio sp.]|nr:ketoacyl-ACP synthase III [Vampirovibrio sp.]